MKNTKTIIFLLAIAVIVLCALFVDHRRRSPSTPKEEAARVEKEADRAEPGPLGQQNPTQSASPVVSQPNPNAAQPPPLVAAKPSRSEQITTGTLSHNVPISFYARVVDQNSMPVPGAKVRLKYRGYLLVAPNVPAENNQPIELASDTDGRFELTGVKGDNVRIEEISKSGYQLSGQAILDYGYTPETLSSDPSHPVVFRMWKKQGADRLVVGDHFYGIVPDGRVYTLDFLAHKKTEGGQEAGDLKVSIKRPATVERKTKFNWSFSVDGIGGGVIESAEEFMNLAPETGYQSHYEFHMDALDTNWVPQLTKQFYIRSRDGKIYSRLSVEVISDYQDKSVFSAKYAVNPTGSRNLEYDPRQTVSTDNFFPPQ